MRETEREAKRMEAKKKKKKEKRERCSGALATFICASEKSQSSSPTDTANQLPYGPIVREPVKAIALSPWDNDCYSVAR